MNRLQLQFRITLGELPDKIRKEILSAPGIVFEGADYDHTWHPTKDPLVFIADTIFRQDVIARVLGAWLDDLVFGQEGVHYTLSEVLCANDPEISRSLTSDRL
jgi:hypothetical protein